VLLLRLLRLLLLRLLLLLQNITANAPRCLFHLISSHTFLFSVVFSRLSSLVSRLSPSSLVFLRLPRLYFGRFNQRPLIPYRNAPAPRQPFPQRMVRGPAQLRGTLVEFDAYVLELGNRSKQIMY
jgi:hypothetical protein